MSPDRLTTTASTERLAVTSGTLTVKLDSYGIDWSGNASTYAHTAVSAVRLTCS